MILRGTTKLENLFLDWQRTKWEITLITKSRNERGDISTKLRKIRIKRECYEQLYANKLDNLNETNLLDIYKLQKTDSRRNRKFQ